MLFCVGSLLECAADGHIETKMKFTVFRCNDRCLSEGNLHIPSRNRGDKIYTLEITDDQSTARRATHYGTQSQKINTENRALSYKFNFFNLRVFIKE